MSDDLPDLELVDGDGSERCGAATESGGACRRQTGGGRCHDHRDTGPDPPENLGVAGNQKWRQLVDTLRAAGKLHAVEPGLIEQAAAFYEARRAARRAIAKHGMVVDGRAGAKKGNPAASKLTSYGREYRMSLKDIQAAAEEAPVRHLDDAEALSGWLEPDGGGDFNPFA